MGGQVMNLAVIIAMGVIVADMVAHAAGTNAFFGGMGSLWQTGINGMLGQSTNKQTASTN